jgi:hypothetical protein
VQKQWKIAQWVDAGFWRWASFVRFNLLKALYVKKAVAYNVAGAYDAQPNSKRPLKKKEV